MKAITLEEYAEAVAVCVELAQQSTSGGRAAAQVLLSAYNGDAFQLDITDLCNLDQENYENAITVIRGRYEIRQEPQQVLQDGSQIFRDLWRQWEGLKLTERAKHPCPDCTRGKIYKNEDDEVGVPCPRCSGTGRICQCGGVSNS